MSHNVVTRSARKIEVLDKMASSYEEIKTLRAQVRHPEEHASERWAVSSQELEQQRRNATTDKLAATASREEGEAH
jgi:hypothetical protein